jgi:hypothetical protein
VSSPRAGKGGKALDLWAALTMLSPHTLFFRLPRTTLSRPRFKPSPGIRDPQTVEEMIILVGLEFSLSGPKRKRRPRASAESGVDITPGGTLGELTRVSTAPRRADFLEGA